MSPTKYLFTYMLASYLFFPLYWLHMQCLNDLGLVYNALHYLFWITKETSTQPYLTPVYSRVS